ncbi:hypothetical protein AXF42_Ash019481 [Apostasia shenzhenica]|uniref:Ubiquitin-like protease family profile domain-containing protein n=1 Tax=Apostasia shenzhenica TaxID=1088818 RepID=A0A2I0AYH3_9ASPA|nr:hypothetical protein AXF42_Ash019481 [Apostasia shenzhenica]
MPSKGTAPSKTLCVTSKCFPRTVRETLDEISHSIPEETKQILKEIGVSQFLLMPPFKVNMPIISSLIYRWDDEAGGFRLGKYFIPFNADVVRTITGLRNKGIAAHITMKTEVSSSCTQVRDELITYSHFDNPNPKTFAIHLLKFLLTNLFFKKGNYSVLSSLLIYAEDVSNFSKYNWCDAIYQFLRKQLVPLSMNMHNQDKKLKGMKAGYIDGFAQLIMIAFLESTNAVPAQHPSLFPCMLRWSPNLFWYHAQSEKLIEDIAGLDPTEEYALGHDDCAEQSREFDKPQENVTTDIPAKPVDQHDTSTAVLLLRLSSVEKLLYSLNSRVVRMDTRLDSCCNILFELRDYWLKGGRMQFSSGDMPEAPEMPTTSTNIPPADGDTLEVKRDMDLDMPSSPLNLDKNLPISPRRRAQLGSIARNVKLRESRKRKEIDSPFVNPNNVKKQAKAIATSTGQTSHKNDKKQDDVCQIVGGIAVEDEAKLKEVQLVGEQTCEDNQKKDKSYIKGVPEMIDDFPQPISAAVKQINALAEVCDSLKKLDIKKWPLTYVQKIPRQFNSNDCGIFVLKYIERLLDKSTDGWTWTEYMNWQDNMCLIRAEIAYEILACGKSLAEKKQ